MIKYLLVVSLFLSNKEPFYIFIDDSDESKILVSELTRDWMKVNPEIHANMNYTQRIESFVSASHMRDLQRTINRDNQIIFIDHKDKRRGDLTKFPSFTILRQRVEQFPKGTFTFSSSALQTVHYISESYHYAEKIDDRENRYNELIARYYKEYEGWLDIDAKVRKKVPIPEWPRIEPVPRIPESFPPGYIYIDLSKPIFGLPQ